MKQDNTQIAELNSQVEELEEMVHILTGRLSNQKKVVVKRKHELLEIMKSTGPATIDELAEKLGVTNKNISSILCQIKSMGYEIMTDSKQRKMLWNVE